MSKKVSEVKHFNFSFHYFIKTRRMKICLGLNVLNQGKSISKVKKMTSIVDKIRAFQFCISVKRTINY